MLGRAITALETAGTANHRSDRTEQIALAHILTTHSLLASRMATV